MAIFLVQENPLFLLCLLGLWLLRLLLTFVWWNTWRGWLHSLYAYHEAKLINWVIRFQSGKQGIDFRSRLSSSRVLILFIRHFSESPSALKLRALHATWSE